VADLGNNSVIQLLDVGSGLIACMHVKTLGK
jgi:hypothetical protein